MKSKYSALAKHIHIALVAGAVVLAPATFAAQDSDKAKKEDSKELETIMVTAQKRVQNTKEVPISIATLGGEKFDAIFSGGDDIQALAIKVPGLFAESSNGRAAPRFYIRGLGNTDFDLAASQPVSIIMDDVVMENVVLKSFPLFDVESLEVIRGPQGTLFGRNTTAGMLKFNTMRPRQDTDGYAKIGVGSFGTFNLEGAAGGGITDELSARVSVLSQNRQNYIDNAATGKKDFTGGFAENAYRTQFLYESGNVHALLNLHGRYLDGTSSIFRANVFTKGSNELNQNFDREKVWYNEGDGNFQKYQNNGASLKLDIDLAGGMTFTSITAKENAHGRGKGDIDGGTPTGPGTIPFQAVTEDQLQDLEQLTQELRLASDTSGPLDWQVGAFYFDSSFGVKSIDGFFGATTVYHENTSWAVFGQSTYSLTDRWDVTGGVRYTHDQKGFSVGDQNVDGFALVIGAAQIQDYDPIDVSDGQVSWELSSNYRVTDDASVYGRVAHGFRAQSIQGRDLAFEGNPSVADSETIDSIELGGKADVLDNTMRLNAAVFYYTINDIQLSAIGGTSQGNALLNADKGTGYGFETDFDWRALDNLTLGAGFSYNHTELQDPNLKVATCGSGMCTPTDPLDAQGRAYVDGNPFPQAPKTILTLNARYDIPVKTGEIYFYGDIAFQGETNLFLYESKEFNVDSSKEAGLRMGYLNYDNNFEVALFGRNITNEENVKGAIDFNNLTGFVNEPRVIGLEIKKNFY